MKQLMIVGLGPGAGLDLTGRAEQALREAEVVVGYTAYVDLVRAMLPHQELISTGMRQEPDRCRLALRLAAQGRRVALVCSGDAGVYGMAGLVYQLAPEYPSVEIRVVPGVTAACGGAAVLGAPLAHDFAVISLSDLLTPWDKIEKRLACAAEADLVLCLYNPRSRGRAGHLRRACEILLRYRDPDTVCGYVRCIGRPGEQAVTLTLAQLMEDETVDMFTTVFIGSSQTTLVEDRMVTPRGYREGAE